MYKSYIDFRPPAAASPRDKDTSSRRSVRSIMRHGQTRRRELRGAASGPLGRLTRRPAQRSGRSEQLTRFQQRLDSRENHRPAAEELSVGTFAQLIVGDLEQTGIPDRFD